VELPPSNRLGVYNEMKKKLNWNMPATMGIMVRFRDVTDGRYGMVPNGCLSPEPSFQMKNANKT